DESVLSRYAVDYPRHEPGKAVGNDVEERRGLAVRETLSQLGEKKAKILHTLTDEVTKVSELAKECGITEAALKEKRRRYKRDFINEYIKITKIGSGEA